MQNLLPPIHTSEETAFLIESYPYGRLRCQKRVWLETNKKGTRLVSRTSNPKRGNDWRNAEKASTYHPFAALYLDADGYVQPSYFSHYGDAPTARLWLENFGAGVNPSELPALKALVLGKERLEIELQARAVDGEKPSYGTPLFREATLAATAFVRENPPA